jgi:tetratricopeptide (TPR) repeat protein
LRAAETEAAMGAFADALELIEPVLPHAKGEDRARLLAVRAGVLAAVGDRTAVHAYREALAVCPPALRNVTRARMARAAVMAGDVAAARDAVDGLEPDGGPDDGAIILAQGMVAYFSGDFEGANAAADRARGRLGEAEPSWQLLDTVALQGLLAHNRGEWFERIRYELQATRDSLELATSVFDSHLCVVEYLLYGPTPHDEVVGLANDLRRSGRQSGALRAVAFATAVLGEAALLSGDLETAERELRDGIDAHRDIGAQAGEALCLQRLAEVQLARGERGEAIALLRESLVKARWTMLVPHLMQRIFGTLIMAAPDAEAARAIVDEADATLGDEDHCQFCQVMYSLPAAIACADVGDLDEARDHLRLGETSAAGWEGTSWQAAVLEARAHVAKAEGAVVEADRLLAEAADAFDASGQPLDAARCRG